MTALPRCENCGVHQPMHHGDRELCCGCYVKAGNPPADWHSVCMDTYFGFTNDLNHFSFGKQKPPQGIRSEEPT